MPPVYFSRLAQDPQFRALPHAEKMAVLEDAANDPDFVNDVADPSKAPPEFNDVGAAVPHPPTGNESSNFLTEQIKGFLPGVGKSAVKTVAGASKLAGLGTVPFTGTSPEDLLALAKTKRGEGTGAIAGDIAQSLAIPSTRLFSGAKGIMGGIARALETGANTGLATGAQEYVQSGGDAESAKTTGKVGAVLGTAGSAGGDILKGFGKSLAGALFVPQNARDMAMLRDRVMPEVLEGGKVRGSDEVLGTEGNPILTALFGPQQRNPEELARLFSKDASKTGAELEGAVNATRPARLDELSDTYRKIRDSFKWQNSGTPARNPNDIDFRWHVGQPDAGINDGARRAVTKQDKRYDQLVDSVVIDPATGSAAVPAGNIFQQKKSVARDAARVFKKGDKVGAKEAEEVALATSGGYRDLLENMNPSLRDLFDKSADAIATRNMVKDAARMAQNSGSGGGSLKGGDLRTITGIWAFFNNPSIRNAVLGGSIARPLKVGRMSYKLGKISTDPRVQKAATITSRSNKDEEQ